MVGIVVKRAAAGVPFDPNALAFVQDHLNGRRVIEDLQQKRLQR